VKSYEVRIARLEKILGPRSQKAALLLLVDLLVQTKNEEEREERSSKRNPPKVNPDEGGRTAVCEFQFRPAPPEEMQPPPAYIKYIAAQAEQVQEHSPPPVQPVDPVRKRNPAEETAPVIDMCVFPEHWKFNRGSCAESDDEQRRRLPPQVF
jgi:hypothetical protein